MTRSDADHVVNARRGRASEVHAAKVLKGSADHAANAGLVKADDHEYDKILDVARSLNLAR